MITETVNAVIILVKGILIGFAVSAPMGPIGVLCAKPSIREVCRICVGLRAASADSVYAIIAFSVWVSAKF